MSFSYVEQDHAYPKLKYPKLQHQHQQPRANRHQVVSGLPDHDYHLEHRSGNDDEEVIFLEDKGSRRSIPTPTTTTSTSKLTTRPKIIYGVPIIRSQNPSTSGSGARDSNQHHRKHHDQDGSGGSDCISDDNEDDDEEEEEVIFAKRQPIENPLPEDDFDDLDEPNQLVIDCPPEDTEPESLEQTETEVVVVDHDHPHQQNGQMATVICLPSGQTVITNIVPIVSITSSTTGADSGIPPANITNNSSASSSTTIRSPFGSDNDASGSGFDGSYDESRDPDDDSEEGPSIDEIRAKRVLDELGIPLSPSDIVNMTIDAFNDVFTKYPMLSNNEAELIRTIRRRGKNKIAAFNCRKRKLDTIQDLAGELTEWRDKQTRLEKQLAALTRIRDLAKAQCNRMQQFVDKHDKFTKYKKVNSNSAET